MSEKNENARVACVRKREDNGIFAIAINRPLDETNKKTFQNLSERAFSVQTMEEGSEVYLYMQSEFGLNGKHIEPSFMAFVRDNMYSLGDVYFDPALPDVTDLTPPEPSKYFAPRVSSVSARVEQLGRNVLDLNNPEFA